jgi:hypothetical protein
MTPATMSVCIIVRLRPSESKRCVDSLRGMAIRLPLFLNFVPVVKSCLEAGSSEGVRTPVILPDHI